MTSHTSNKAAILVDHVSKKYCRSQKLAIRYGAIEVLRSLTGTNPHHGELRDSEYWAVQDVSFAVKPGECLGVIGPNGSGKTTLLKMIGGIYPPDSGEICVRGRVGTLIELGAGFHPLLSGRENIYINGAILGLTRKEIERRFDEIVDFSGLEDFIDSPVQHYSSGMYIRLGFAVAVHSSPDVLLVDEALAVGDAAFQIQCLNKISNMRDNGTAILLVSHSEMKVRETVDRCLLLDHGKGTLFDSVDNAFLKYQEVVSRQPRALSPLIHTDYQDVLRIATVNFHSYSKIKRHPPGVTVAGDALSISLEVEAMEAVSGAYLVMRIWSMKGPLAAVVDSRDTGQTFDLLKGTTTIRATIDPLPLVPGRYRIGGGFRVGAKVLGWSTQLAWLDLQPGDIRGNKEGIALVTATVDFDRAQSLSADLSSQ